MKNPIVNRLNDFGLKTKMFLGFIILIFIPFILISFFMVNSFRDIMYERSFTQTQENLKNSQNLTVESLNTAIKLSDKISVMTEVRDIVHTKYESDLEIFQTYHNFTYFRDIVTDYNEITGVKLYVQNDTMLNNWEFIPVNKDINSKRWYNSAIASKGKICWLNFQDESKDKRSKLSLVRRIYFREYNTYAVLVIDIDTARLNSVFPNDSYETFITNSFGNVVSSGNREWVNMFYRDIASDFPKLDSQDGVYDVHIEGNDYKLLIANVELDNSANGLKIFSLFSTSTIIKDSNYILGIGFKVMFFVCILAIISLYTVYRTFIQRLINVQSSMDIVANGNFESQIEVDGKDEIGKLSSHFNKMVRNINKLLQEIEDKNRINSELEKHQNQIKLQMLASQINPHFLFNSLEAIRMKAHIDKQPDLANIVKQLGRLMRNILEIDGSWTTLDNELKIIQSFLYIEKFRLDNHLEYKLDIDSRVESLALPPLLIQPIVENALIHGIEKKSGGGLLKLSIKIEDEYLRIMVEDNGPGADLQRIHDLLYGQTEYAKAHIGLRNINQRLKLSFGDESSLDISNPDGGGTKVQFKISMEYI